MAIAEVPPGPSRGDGRVPPYNLEAEESLLGAMLLSKDAIVAASELGISPDDFYKPVHGHVFEAITSLYSAGEPADPVTVAEELRRAGLLNEIGGPGLLASLQIRTPATSSAARYARIVSEHAVLRRLIAVAGEIAEMGYRVPDDVAEAVDRAEAMVFDVAQHRVSDTLAPIRDLLDDSLTRLEMLYEKADAITGIPTGYHGLDELLSGLQPSSLVIVGARPATGKCLTGDTVLTDPRTGARRTLAEVYRRGRGGEPVEVISLGTRDRRLHTRRPSAFVDDGVRPVFRVRTRLGREVRTTASHPFLTPAGWRPLSEIAVGTPVAVPRALPLFGDEELPESELVLLAHLLDDRFHGSTSPRFSSASAAVMVDLTTSARALGIDCVPERGAPGTSTCRLTAGARHPRALVELLARHGLLGVRAHQRGAPPAIFRLPRPQLARFLNRLLGDGGSAWWSPRGGGSPSISYCSVSSALVADVAHLLLRFGINARRRRRVIHRQGWRGPAHELEVTSIPEIRRLAREIGMFSKEAALANLLRRIDHDHTLEPTDPSSGWPEERPVPGRARSLVAASVGGVAPPASPERPARRPLLQDRAARPQAPAAHHDQAAPMVGWDEIVSIDSAGEERVYDLTVPGDHNFVAADIFVHNTAFALGLAAHAALEANRPVLFFSLEMSHLEITQRILASEARVDSSRMRNGKLAESDWTKIAHAIGRLGEAPLYIDDNPRATVLEIRAKARRLKSRLGDLGIVVVDYLQLMTGRDRAENRQVEVSEISRGLKVLARELQTPVVALSQLSRGLELRADKRPMLADLRESGCLTAGTRVLRADTGTEVTLGELAASGVRDIPVWTVDADLAVVPGTMTSAFPTGVQPVFELRLASGRRIRASANHRFLTAGGWRRLDQLNLGTRLAVPRPVPVPARRPHGAEHWRELAVAGPRGPGGLTSAVAAHSAARHRLRRLAAVLDDADLDRRARAGVHWDPVVAIEPLGSALLFDATVPGTHNFVANGIVVHNSLEQDADVVIFLYRDEIYNADSPERGTAEVLVAKHRSGPTGMDRLAFLDHYTRFANMAKSI